MKKKKKKRDVYEKALWKIYNRREIPRMWSRGGNLPWNDPEFSKRMLLEHLDESHGAASRTTSERLMIIEKIWRWLHLQSGSHLLDMTCGPGLYATEFASRGCQVTGVDFSPASIHYARQLAQDRGVAGSCLFIEEDVRSVSLAPASFDAAMFIYGQLSVFPHEDVRMLLSKIAAALRPGGSLCIELLDPDRIDKKQSSWWFTDDKGLWGDTPFLHLGERFWLEDQQMVIERFQIINLENGRLDKVILCDQAYSSGSMVKLMEEAGFTDVSVFTAWDNLALYDADQWIAYVGKLASPGTSG